MSVKGLGSPLLLPSPPRLTWAARSRRPVQRGGETFLPRLLEKVLVF